MAKQTAGVWRTLSTGTTFINCKTKQRCHFAVVGRDDKLIAGQPLVREGSPDQFLVVVTPTDAAVFPYTEYIAANIIVEDLPENDTADD